LALIATLAGLLGLPAAAQTSSVRNPLARLSNNYCSFAPNHYFCANDCDSYYYCNGEIKGKQLQCPSGTRCIKQGPHLKYYDTETEGREESNFDEKDVSYACQKTEEATDHARKEKRKQCWAEGLPDPVERVDKYSIQNQCNAPLDIVFVMDSSLSIVEEQEQEYARAREFVKTFMSYFNVAADFTKIGFISFSTDVAIVDKSGKQKCANRLTKPMLLTPDAEHQIEMSNMECPAATDSDLNEVLQEDPSMVARSIDMKMLGEGTKMFLGMSLARRVLDLNRKPGREQVIIVITDGIGENQDEFRAQAQELERNGVRIITVAAGHLVRRAKEGDKRSLKAMAMLRNVASKCQCKHGVCSGDCYSAENYQKLIDTTVAEIVRKSGCEKLSSVELLDSAAQSVCTTAASTTLVAKGRGFGVTKPAEGDLVFKIGEKLFPGKWVSNHEAVVELPRWRNGTQQYGPQFEWDPVHHPWKSLNLPLSVSNDGGRSFFVEDPSSRDDLIVTIKACWSVDEGLESCHQGLDTVTVRRVGPAKDHEHEAIVCKFGNVKVSARWIDATRATCQVPRMNCSTQSVYCEASMRQPNLQRNDTTLSDDPDAPDQVITVPFDFSVDDGEYWVPQRKEMQSFRYVPCPAECEERTGSFLPWIVLFISLLLCFWASEVLIFGDDDPQPMPTLEKTVDNPPEPPTPLEFGIVSISVIERVRRAPRKKLKTIKVEKKKKKWAVTSTGQYLRAGRTVAVGWGKYGETTQGEDEQGDSDSSSSSGSDDDYDDVDQLVAEAFEDVETHVQMPQAPEEVAMPQFAPVAANTFRAKVGGRARTGWRRKWLSLLCFTLFFLTGPAVYGLLYPRRSIVCSPNPRLAPLVSSADAVRAIRGRPGSYSSARTPETGNQNQNESKE
jgi:hypothetical protein